METIASASNQHLKLIRRLASTSGRAREGAFVVEGEDLVQAGLVAGWTPRVVLCATDVAPDLLIGHERHVRLVERALLAEVSTLGHPPRVLAVFDEPGTTVEQVLAAAPAASPLVYLDGVGDPGNVGTVVRSARALGAGGLLLGTGSADPYGPKATRASMGGVFTLPVARHAVLEDVDRQVLVLDASGTVDLWDTQITADAVICIGAERAGVSKRMRSRADVIARIPQTVAVDSVNAGVAASIALYEWRRQHPATMQGMEDTAT